VGGEQHGIRVNTVSPGPTDTDLFYVGKSEELVKSIESLSPFNRLGQPEEIAEAVVFLATSGSWVSGQNIRVNGGAYV
jgi:3-oxoacyl-[acyl-carrier protein] reductase